MSQVDVCFLDDDDDDEGTILAKKAGLLGDTSGPPSSSDGLGHRHRNSSSSDRGPPEKSSSHPHSSNSSVSSIGIGSTNGNGQRYQYPGSRAPWNHGQGQGPPASPSNTSGAVVGDVRSNTYSGLGLFSPSDMKSTSSAWALGTPSITKASANATSTSTKMPSLTPMNRVRDDKPLSIFSNSGGGARVEVASTVMIGQETYDGGHVPFVFTTGDDEEDGEITE